jgi:hypothetical protein
MSLLNNIEHELQVWIDDELVWQGVMWDFTGDSTTVTLDCEGLLSLFKGRFIDTSSVIYGTLGDPGNPNADPPIPPTASVGMEQFFIAWDLLRYAQDESNEPYRDLNIDASNFGSSGVQRFRQYLRDDHKNILDALMEFDSRTLDRGFDWEIVTDGSGGRFWTPYYPRKGAAKADLAFEYDSQGSRNIAGFTWSRIGRNMATKVYATGGTVSVEGADPFKVEGNYENEAASAQYGQHTAIISEGSQLDHDWLTDRATREVNARDHPQVITQIKSVRSKDIDLFGKLVTGDWVPVYIDYGLVQSNAWYRVEQVKLNADDSLEFSFGSEMVGL